MTTRDNARAAVSEVLAASEPVRLADMSADVANYFRRSAAAQGVTTDAEVDELLAANVRRPEPDLDAIAARRRGGIR